MTTLIVLEVRPKEVFGTLLRAYVDSQLRLDCPHDETAIKMQGMRSSAVLLTDIHEELVRRAMSALQAEKAQRCLYAGVRFIDIARRGQSHPVQAVVMSMVVPAGIVRHFAAPMMNEITPRNVPDIIAKIAASMRLSVPKIRIDREEMAIAERLSDAVIRGFDAAIEHLDAKRQ